MCVLLWGGGVLPSPHPPAAAMPPSSPLPPQSLAPTHPTNTPPSHTQQHSHHLNTNNLPAPRPTPPRFPTHLPGCAQPLQTPTPCCTASQHVLAHVFHPTSQTHKHPADNNNPSPHPTPPPLALIAHPPAGCAQSLQSPTPCCTTRHLQLFAPAPFSVLGNPSAPNQPQHSHHHHYQTPPPQTHTQIVFCSNPNAITVSTHPPARMRSIFANSHSLLHRGQALRVLSQRWMQSRWNTWPHTPQAMDRPGWSGSPESRAVRRGRWAAQRMDELQLQLAAGRVKAGVEHVATHAPGYAEAGVIRVACGARGGEGANMVFGVA
jgi:hypothetical protein